MSPVRVFAASRALEGAGFEVQRGIPIPGLSALGPFIMLDHIGPVDVPAGKAVGAPTHPHAGIETLSYFIEGSGLHYDSLGNRAITGPGEVQWMRAGRGIIHDEGPDENMMRDGGRNHMVQLWLNMPGQTKNEAPEYRSFTRDMIPVVELKTGGSLRVITGDLADVSGPLITHGNPLLAHGTIPANTNCELELQQIDQCGLFVLNGVMTINDNRVGAEHLVVLNPQTDLQIRSHSPADFLLLGGDRVTDELVRHGPFVANSEADMRQVITDYQRGAFGQLQKEG